MPHDDEVNLEVIAITPGTSATAQPQHMLYVPRMAASYLHQGLTSKLQQKDTEATMRF